MWEKTGRCWGVPSMQPMEGKLLGSRAVTHHGAPGRATLQLLGPQTEATGNGEDSQHRD